MAVLAPQDWHPPKELAMDSPASNGSNSTIPKQHPNNNLQSQPGQAHLNVQQPYPYPVQQQQAGWTPNHSAQPFYPSFYQNPHQYPQQPQIAAQNNPYYDHAANQQFAQWAYQQMMFNAQQQGQQHSHYPNSSQQRGRSGSGSSTQPDYFVPPNAQFHPFPSGTPPPAPPPAAAPHSFPRSTSTDQAQLYNGFHPYRRPNRQQNQDSSQAAPSADWRSGATGSFQPPYARNDASGSSTSVNSTTESNSSRRRNDSFHGSGSRHSSHSPTRTSQSNGASSRSNNNVQPSGSSSQRPHYRTASASSNSSTTTRPNVTSSSIVSASLSSIVTTSTATQAPSTTLPRPSKPSPLSQGNFTAAEKRMSRDDSDLAKMMEPSTTVPGGRGGLKGRLRRVLSFNPSNALREEDESEGSTPKGKATTGKPGVVVDKSQPPEASTDPGSSGTKKKSRTALFNSRLNASTDNISLSSTMSSASMVIRKLGSMAKITRRNSLAGITSIFKDKKDKEDSEAGKSKKKKNAKSDVAEASVSHVTAELDRSEWSAELNGLSPAARLARQHTLKSNAEAAARAKEPEVAASAVAGGTPVTWEKNTTTRQGDGANEVVAEDGTRIVVEEDSDEEDKFAVANRSLENSGSMDGWDDTEDWGEEDEDITIRGGVEGMNLDQEEDIEMEPWAVDLRRSVERTRAPAKGILKTTAYTTEEPSTRTRSNSYDAAPHHTPEPTALARISSTDPDHIDGLHTHSPVPSTPFLPPLSFGSDSHKTTASPESSIPPTPHHDKIMFSHSNSSAPALSAMFSSNPPTLSHRSATAPVKRLAFASNLSVYDTFPSSVYDRRSEPATWSRLTPALAQRIKEELNSYKMEEMEVHASSRIHTQFFV